MISFLDTSCTDRNNENDVMGDLLLYKPVVVVIVSYVYIFPDISFNADSILKVFAGSLSLSGVLTIPLPLIFSICPPSDFPVMELPHCDPPPPNLL